MSFLLLTVDTFNVAEDFRSLPVACMVLRDDFRWDLINNSFSQVFCKFLAQFHENLNSNGINLILSKLKCTFNTGYILCTINYSLLLTLLQCFFLNVRIHRYRQIRICLYQATPKQLEYSVTWYSRICFKWFLVFYDINLTYVLLW